MPGQLSLQCHCKIRQASRRLSWDVLQDYHGMLNSRQIDMVLQSSGQAVTSLSCEAHAKSLAKERVLMKAAPEASIQLCQGNMDGVRQEDDSDDGSCNVESGRCPEALGRGQVVEPDCCPESATLGKPSRDPMSRCSAPA